MINWPTQAAQMISWSTRAAKMISWPARGALHREARQMISWPARAARLITGPTAERSLRRQAARHNGSEREMIYGPPVEPYSHSQKWEKETNHKTNSRPTRSRTPNPLCCVPGRRRQRGAGAGRSWLHEAATCSCVELSGQASENDTRHSALN